MNDDGDLDQPKKIILEIEKDRKIFLLNMNDYIIKILIEKLRKNKLNHFSGTVTSKDKLPKNFNPEIIKINPLSTYNNDKLFENDYFICSLKDSKFSELEYILKGLKALEHKSEKYLILVSDIMTWARTQQKIKTEKKEEEDENDEDQQGDPENKVEMEKEPEEIPEEDIVTENIEDEEDKENEDQENMDNNDNMMDNMDNQGEVEETKYILFNDKDYKLRIPDPEFYAFKNLETLALSASNTNKMLKCYIICPGFLYGLDERFFYNYFKVRIIFFRLDGYKNLHLYLFIQTTKLWVKIGSQQYMLMI